ncbi:MAG: hypothetical protein QOG96_324, partial [Pseudonocardiales bacterium]|nr:hypothetical protein [Pseudonocardiales bacterium]
AATDATEADATVAAKARENALLLSNSVPQSTSPGYQWMISGSPLASAQCQAASSTVPAVPTVPAAVPVPGAARRRTRRRSP